MIAAIVIINMRYAAAIGHMARTFYVDVGQNITLFLVQGDRILHRTKYFPTGAGGQSASGAVAPRHGRLGPAASSNPSSYS